MSIKSQYNDRMVKVDSRGGVRATVAPGRGKVRGSDMKPLGKLDQLRAGKDHKVVILHKAVTGADKAPRLEGQVVRLSELIPGYEKDPALGIPRSSDSFVASVVERLFGLGAIRLATLEESPKSRIDIDPMEPVEVTEQRDKLVRAEKKGLKKTSEEAAGADWTLEDGTEIDEIDPKTLEGDKK